MKKIPGKWRVGVMSDAFMDDPAFDPDDIAAAFFGVPTPSPPFTIPGFDDGDAELIDIESGRRQPTSDDFDQDDATHVSRYDGYSYVDHEKTSGVPRDSDVRPGARDRRNDNERALRAARAAGTRQIQRSAATHTGGDVAGGEGSADSGTDEHPLAQSLADAQSRFRAEQALPESRDNTLVEAALASSPVLLERGGYTRTATQLEETRTRLTRSHGQITEVPKFTHAEFEAQFYGLKANASGDWMLTLRIPAGNYDEVMKMSQSHGLALDVDISRRPIARAEV